MAWQFLNVWIQPQLCCPNFKEMRAFFKWTYFLFLGFSSGYRLVEKITREHPKFKDELELMKFICKDYWMCIFRKQIDNLRTNHQGVYVLQDKSFKYLQSISASKQYFEDSSVFLVFTCGLLRGSLANLGIKSVVTTEVVSLPG